MKKYISLLLIISIAITYVTSSFAIGISEYLRPYYVGDIVFSVNNNPIWVDNPILNRNGRTFIPLRDLEKVDDSIKLHYDGSKVYVFCERYNYYRGMVTSSQEVTIVFTIGNPIVHIYTEPFEDLLTDAMGVILDTSPFIENGRTYVPVRFICEQLNWNVYFYKGDIYAFTKSSDGIKEEQKFRDEIRRAEEEEQINSVQHDGVTPYDAYGALVKKYDRVIYGVFYGTVYDVYEDQAYVYWDSYNTLMVSPNNVEQWAAIAGIKMEGYQWIKTKDLTKK